MGLRAYIPEQRPTAMDQDTNKAIQTEADELLDRLDGLCCGFVAWPVVRNLIDKGFHNLKETFDHQELRRAQRRVLDALHVNFAHCHPQWPLVRNIALNAFGQEGLNGSYNLHLWKGFWIWKRIFRLRIYPATEVLPPISPQSRSKTSPKILELTQASPRRSSGYATSPKLKKSAKS